MSGKTRDGIKISDILSAARNITGLSIREGTKHPYMLIYPGLRPCPVAESTHAKHMIVPWMRTAIGTAIGYDSQTIYEGLKTGEIPYKI